MNAAENMTPIAAQQLADQLHARLREATASGDRQASTAVLLTITDVYGRPDIEQDAWNILCDRLSPQVLARQFAGRIEAREAIKAGRVLENVQ